MGASAASRGDLHREDMVQIKLANAAIAASGTADTAHTRHERALGLDADSRLFLIDRQTSNGVKNTRYLQTFRGIPVFGESVVVSEDTAGNVRTLFGQKVTDLASQIPAGRVRLNANAALSIGKSAGLGNRVGFMRTSNESSKLMIYVDDAGRATKAYVVSYFADTANNGSPTRPTVIVDANTGAVLKKFENLQHALVGTGPGGNTKTGQYEWGSGGKYGFMDVTQSGTTCTMNNTNVRAVNLNGGTGSSTTAYSYTCPRNTFKTVNGGYSPINDAFQFGGFITGMYPAYTGYNALSFQLIMRVHYSSNYENAFWNGSNMSFGDGASTFYPLVSADVAGHEVSHGFTEQHSNLTYSGQSGGMNEAFSDMGGEATEYYWKGTADYLVGAEIFKGSGALRYMCTPTQDGRSIDNAANYTSSLDVHYSSGVYNKAFCTLAKTTGWGIPKAFKVFARANAAYWTASSTFNQGACGVETAATDLGFTKADVTAAFTAVGVSCGGGGGGTGTVVQNITLPSVATGGVSSTYSYTIPSGTTKLVVAISGGTGDADLYVRAGSAPTTSSYTCRPYLSGNAETCTINSPTAGTTYYWNVRAYSAYSGVNLKATKTP
ncbi:MAG: M4 family metallopeptidase [Lysobacteraceae bacterium]